MTTEHQTAETRADPLEELRALSDVATPGPWVDQSPDDGVRPDSEWWIDTHAYADGPEPVVNRNFPLSGADAVFIAAAVNYVRSLLTPGAPDHE